MWGSEVLISGPEVIKFSAQSESLLPCDIVLVPTEDLIPAPVWLRRIGDENPRDYEPQFEYFKR
jgi:hypothetical protein